ncbi:MAG: helix-turn-helix domain-containing protein [Candidatus Omnitrophica bacterium]|nr:helix-turn-helix domain-containing protein [Candidatus Omnitrophota bacterium]MBU1090272.1 helix-turn-helix domain-containing protein [Candidatus Omnitrophota bacterium]
MNRGLISTQDIVRRYKLSYQTVNYYTNLGLLTVRKRNGNARFYKAGEVRVCLSNIAKLKNRGYSLKLIRELMRKPA